MNIYVETNFVLELTFQQEQCTSCEQILLLCEAGYGQLVIPAYSLAEPHKNSAVKPGVARKFNKPLMLSCDNYGAHLPT